MDDQPTTSNKKKFLILAVLAGLLIFVVFAVNQNRKVPLQPIKRVTQSIQNPRKTDFGANMPTDFPADFPLEKRAKVEQSYSLNYAGQKQLTIVFQSTKTVKENYALYADFLKEQNWNVSNKYESAKVSSLYGTKETSGLNVAISENTSSTLMKSQVNISFLKKL